MNEESERQNIQIYKGQATHKKQNSDPQPAAINPGNNLLSMSSIQGAKLTSVAMSPEKQITCIYIIPKLPEPD